MDQLADHYFLEEEIGKGAFAIVYKARDIRLNRTVAIKVLREDRPKKELSFARLLSEGRAASALNHENICKLYDIGADQDIDYVVLEHIEGQTLKVVLASGPLPIKVALEQGSEIAGALANAHESGILHRDLTPSNVMVTPSGHIKVIDFGLARSVADNEIIKARESWSSLEEAGGLGGTLPYVAPEVLHGKPATAQSDIWSLGAILYEMLTGNLPFPGHTLFEVSTAIMLGKMNPLPERIPAGLRGIVCRCLSRNTERRYQLASTAANHLRAELASFEVKSRSQHLNSFHSQSSVLASSLCWLVSLLGIRSFTT